MATRKKTGKKQKATIMGGEPLGVKRPTRVRPFPEIIDEQDWEVREGRYPSFIKRAKAAGDPHLMQVPLGNTQIDRKIRLHEQAHVTWTPDVAENDERIRYLHEIETLNATEDARLITLMSRTSPEWKELNEKEVGLLTPQMESAFQDGFARLSSHLKGEKPVTTGRDKVMTLVEAARLIASTRGYAEGRIFDQLAHSNDLGWVVDDVNKMHKKHIFSQEKPEFQNSIDFAYELEDYFWQKQQEIEEMNEAMEQAGFESDGTTEAMREVKTPEIKERREGGKTPLREPKKPDRTEDRGDRWGKLTVVHKPLTEKLAARHARRPRPTDLGAVPRYMHRLMSDQRVFGRRRKKKAYEGTVLIDTSGSMSLTPEMVDEMLRRWPAATIGTYCGTEDWGELWIVASNGKRAAKQHLHPQLGGNVVDGPALDWLAKQKMPRIWISDGGVSGVRENFGPHFKQDAAKKIKKGKIKRLANVHALLGGDEFREDYDNEIYD